MSFADDVAQLLPELRIALLARRVREHDVDDLLQDTYMRAISREHLYDIGRPLRAWLVTMAMNLFRNRLDSRKRRKAVTIYTEEGAVDLVDHLTVSEDDVDTDDHAAHLRSRLDPELDRIVDAAYRFGHAEAAEMLGVTVSTVKNRVHKALLAMRKERGTVEPMPELIDEPVIVEPQVVADPMAGLIARVRQRTTSASVPTPYMTTRRQEAIDHQKKVNSAVYYHKTKGWIARVNSAEIQVADRSAGLKLVAA